MLIMDFVQALPCDYFTGVPDSQLKALCDYLMFTYGKNAAHHVIAANEGNAVGLAAGYHLATGKVPVVYLQNSGIGNIINPVASLMNDHVYGIPCIFVVGWRGEPNVHDEPQHLFQGKVTLKLLEDMDIATYIISKDTTESQVQEQITAWKPMLAAGKQVAFVVKKGALSFDEKVQYENPYSLAREEAIRHIVDVTGEDLLVCTTGKASRELFEIRAARGQGHEKDFLTVGSMGHSSSIAMGIAMQQPSKQVWCLDGDGAAIMHMGSMAVIGTQNPHNLVHIILNNEAHETVGGMPTAAGQIDLPSIAKACGYPQAYSVDTVAALDEVLLRTKNAHTLCLIEVKCMLGARADLGRPTVSARENKNGFMKNIRNS